MLFAELEKCFDHFTQLFTSTDLSQYSYS